MIFKRDETVVILKCPHDWQRSTTNTETWITMVEQLLICDFKDFELTITQDTYAQSTEIAIKFASVEDAVWFELIKG